MIPRIYRLASGLALGLAALGVACGGSSDSSKPLATAPAAGDESVYADAVCSAAGAMFASYQKDFASSSGSLTGMDPTDAYMKIARVPYRRLVSDLNAIVPPANLRTGHADLVRRASDLLAAIDAGDRTRVLALKGTPDTGTWKQVVEVPDELKTRLGPIASTRPACQALKMAGGGAPFE